MSAIIFKIMIINELEKVEKEPNILDVKDVVTKLLISLMCDENEACTV